MAAEVSTAINDDEPVETQEDEDKIEKDLKTFE